MQDISDQKNGKKSFQIKFLCTECGMNLSNTEVLEMLIGRRMTRHLCRYCLGVATEVMPVVDDGVTEYEVIRVEEKLKELYEEHLYNSRNLWTSLRWTAEEAVEHNRKYLFYQRLYHKLTGKYWKEPVPEMSFDRRRYLETHYPGSYPKKEECCDQPGHAWWC